MEVSCFIPAWNEERLIGSTVLRLDEVLRASAEGHEIIVVDDASTDNTARVVEALGMPHVRVALNDRGPSFRENLGRALLSGQGRVLMLVDADLAIAPEHVPLVLQAVRSEADVAVGSRYLPESKTTRSLGRTVISHAYNATLRTFLGSTLRDHQCGLKAFRREVIAEVLPQMRADPEFRRGWFWDAEVLLRAHWAGRRVKEVPVRWSDRPDSRARIWTQYRIVPWIFRLFRDKP